VYTFSNIKEKVDEMSLERSEALKDLIDLKSKIEVLVIASDTFIARSDSSAGNKKDVQDLMQSIQDLVFSYIECPIEYLSKDSK